MPTHNPSNERVKHRYFEYLKEAKQNSEATVDAVAAALARFEADTRFRDFRAFHFAQAIAFKDRLARKRGRESGRHLSQATVYATLAHLKRFFQWLAGQPGFKSRLRYSDAEYFNPSEKDSRVATARRERPSPTLEQVVYLLHRMPSTTEIERRNRALIAFTLLTGARDSATASLKLRHIDLAAGCVHQDGRDVKTKFSKTFVTYFFPVGAEARQAFESWVTYLREVKVWGNDDPVFPATEVVPGPSRHFEVTGLRRANWRNASPIRAIFRAAFSSVDLPYFHPHSFRHTLAQFGEAVCQGPEEFRAWSQNLGHDDVLTTFTSYGQVPAHRQREIILGLGGPRRRPSVEVAELAKAVAREIAEIGRASLEPCDS